MSILHPGFRSPRSNSTSKGSCASLDLSSVFNNVFKGFAPGFEDLFTPLGGTAWMAGLCSPLEDAR